MMTSKILVCAAALAGAIAACSATGRGVEGPAAMQEPGGSAELFAAAVEYLAGEVRGRARVDPRPLRPGADLAGIGEDDLMPGAADLTRLRGEALAARGIGQTDATADQRCVFSGGIPSPPDTGVADRAPSTQRQGECGREERHATLILGVPSPAVAAGHPAGTWRVDAVSMDGGGFRIWDVFLRADADGRWRVIAADARFSIWS